MSATRYLGNGDYDHITPEPTLHLTLVLLQQRVSGVWDQGDPQMSAQGTFLAIVAYLFPILVTYVCISLCHGQRQVVPLGKMSWPSDLQYFFSSSPIRRQVSLHLEWPPRTVWLLNLHLPPSFVSQYHLSFAYLSSKHRPADIRTKGSAMV